MEEVGPSPAVAVERCGDAVARVVLGGPQRKNPLTPEMKEQLPVVLGELDADPSVRAVVLTGKGAEFCAGADVNRLMPHPDRIRAYGMRRTVLAANRLARALHYFEKPLVAAVDGDAIGAGLVIALHADIVLASRRARFGAGFITFSLVPDIGGSYLLPRIVGLPRAKELVFSGRLVDAEEAQTMGMVSRIVDDDRLQEEALQLARRLAAMPTACIGLTKGLLDDNANASFQEALDREALAQSYASTLDDFREGYEAFQEKRRAVYGGSLEELRPEPADGASADRRSARNEEAER